MQQPAVLALYLGGDGELVILLRQALAVLLDDLADGDAPEDWGASEPNLSTWWFSWKRKKATGREPRWPRGDGEGEG